MINQFTYEGLLSDLHTAYYDARRHKRTKAYQLILESHLEQNLSNLCKDLWWRTYKASPSECFIITDPKKLEVFAAAFRDRVVHHLYYNYIYKWLVRTFIADTYSCIKGRGTLYGIHRPETHIRRESRDYTRSCHVLKMDIRGYFMRIDRCILLNLVLTAIDRRQDRGALTCRIRGSFGARIEVPFHTTKIWKRKPYIQIQQIDYQRIKGHLPAFWRGLSPLVRRAESKVFKRPRRACKIPQWANFQYIEYRTCDMIKIFRNIFAGEAKASRLPQFKVSSGEPE